MYVGMGGWWERMNAARDRRGRASRDAAATEAIRVFIDEWLMVVDECDVVLVIYIY